MAKFHYNPVRWNLKKRTRFLGYGQMEDWRNLLKSLSIQLLYMRSDFSPQYGDCCSELERPMIVICQAWLMFPLAQYRYHSAFSCLKGFENLGQFLGHVKVKPWWLSNSAMLVTGRRFLYCSWGFSYVLLIDFLECVFLSLGWRSDNFFSTKLVFIFFS